MIPIIVVTGDATAEIHEKCDQLGVSRFLLKPWIRINYVMRSLHCLLLVSMSRVRALPDTRSPAHEIESSSFYRVVNLMSIKTRFAPSPTGYLHVGGARTALFSWLHARKHGGKYVLRIEDTDLQRSTAESINAILEAMTWLGLDYDEGPFYQTRRFDRYNEVIDELLQQNLAYRCNCSRERLEALREGQMQRKEKPRYDGHCRARSVDADEPHVIRFRSPPEGSVVIDDQVRGKIVFQNDELDDLIIRRTDGSPTYNLTVVVDDLDMGITDVIRGDDHVNNTPRQVNILKALGKEPPRYAHVPMILGDDGSRLSKRHGAVSVMEYRNQGILPEALLNYLVRLGWSHGDEELFTLDQMVELFDIKDVNKAASAFQYREVALDQSALYQGRRSCQNCSIVKPAYG